MAGAAHVSSTLPPIEEVAEYLHDADVRAKKNAGTFEERLPSGENIIVSYSELSDASRAAVADKVRIVYAAIDALTEQPKTRKAG